MDKPVDFLKIDIEGSETKVLRECRDNLAKVERMFIEYHAHELEPQTLDEILDIVKKAGFKFYIEGGEVNSKQPFVNIEKRLGYSMLLSIFCYR